MFLSRGSSYPLTEGGRIPVVHMTLEGSSQSPGDQAHTVRKAPGLSAGVTVTYNAQYFSQQQWRFLSYGFFLFKDTERG